MDRQRESEKRSEPMYIDVKRVMADWGCSKSKAYDIINELSARMKAENPKLITMSGKINRIYYNEACLKDRA